MRVGPTVLGLLASTPAALAIEELICGGDDLYECFTESIAKASEYCTKSVAVSGPVDTVTVTPTVYVFVSYRFW